MKPVVLTRYPQKNETMRVNRIPHILTTMALEAVNGTNRTWAGEWKRSDRSPIEWAMGLRWRATESQGKWTAVYLLAVAAAGPQQTIDGRIVNNPVATCMWSGCSLCPKFVSHEECQAWIDDVGLPQFEY